MFSDNGSTSLRSFEGSRGSTHPMDSLSDIEYSVKPMTIKDYYHASSTTDEKQLTYQHGLSNYSSVVLGDDRIAYTKSMTQCMFDMDREALEESNLGTPKPKKINRSENARRRAYNEAISACGGAQGVLALEKIISLKLAQRNKFGPFQFLKNFKYFDRSNSGYVDEVDFTRALNLMGYQFNDHQILALFGKYECFFCVFCILMLFYV